MDKKKRAPRNSVRVQSMNGFKESLNDGFLQLPPPKKLTYGKQKRRREQMRNTSSPRYVL